MKWDKKSYYSKSVKYPLDREYEINVNKTYM